MDDLTRVISTEQLDRLRQGFSGTDLATANARAFAQVYPPLAAWGEVVATTFFQRKVLGARERELCMVTLLAHRAPGVSLANHIYWGLMEGVSVAEICEAIGLSGCYGGLPTYTSGMLVLHKTLVLLARIANEPAHDAATVLRALALELAGAAL